MKEMLYEFEEDYVVDDSRFRAAFGAETTPIKKGDEAHLQVLEKQHAAKVK